MSLSLRCGAHRHGVRWHAICVDLDIAADGATLDDARVALAECVALYLDAVEGMPADERRRAMARRAPWHVRAKMALLAWVQKSRGCHATAVVFFLGFPALIAVRA